MLLEVIMSVCIVERSLRVIAISDALFIFVTTATATNNNTLSDINMATDAVMVAMMTVIVMATTPTTASPDTFIPATAIMMLLLLLLLMVAMMIAWGVMNTFSTPCMAMVLVLVMVNVTADTITTLDALIHYSTLTFVTIKVKWLTSLLNTAKQLPTRLASAIHNFVATVLGAAANTAASVSVNNVDAAAAANAALAAPAAFSSVLAVVVAVFVLVFAAVAPVAAFAAFSVIVDVVSADGAVVMTAVTVVTAVIVVVFATTAGAGACTSVFLMVIVTAFRTFVCCSW